MLRQKTANLVFTVLLLASCAYFAGVAQGCVTSGLLGSQGLPSKFFPHVTLGGIAVCGLIVGYLYLTNSPSVADDEETVFANPTEARQGILML